VLNARSTLCAVAIAAFARLLDIAAASAQAPATPIPLIPSAPPRSIEAAPLPEPAMPGSPGPPSAETAPPPSATLTPSAAPEASTRVFCQQPVTVRLADRALVPDRYRGFIGVWSDAVWTPQLCAALVVENVAPDGTATILYAFGPIGSNARGPGGVLNGTGTVQDGELRFQNSDGSQFAFRPLYADLEGHLITPQGQSYRAIFKKTP
jgi:hypothetical protein